MSQSKSRVLNSELLPMKYNVLMSTSLASILSLIPFFLLGKRCIALYTRKSQNQAKIFSMPCDRHLFFICEEAAVTRGDIVASSPVNSTAPYSTAGHFNDCAKLEVEPYAKC